jgi:hypothetical protein
MGFDIKFPESLKPYLDSYKQAYVGLVCWQSREFVNPEVVEAALGQLEYYGKATAGIALSSDLTDLPPGPRPNVSHQVRPALIPLIAGKNLFRIMTSLTQFFVGHCYALMEEESRLEAHRMTPVIQFLRHIRNGCFHGNRFNIEDPAKKGKKWREAKWRGKEITLALNGKRVFRASFEEAELFLNWGDAILLLSDACAIAYPSSK